MTLNMQQARWAPGAACSANSRPPNSVITPAPSRSTLVLALALMVLVGGPILFLAEPSVIIRRTDFFTSLWAKQQQDVSAAVTAEAAAAAAAAAMEKDLPQAVSSPSSVRSRYALSPFNRTHMERACSVVRASCRQEGGSDETVSTHPGVRARLNGLSGQWHFGLDVESRFPSLNYSASGVRYNWRCSSGVERAGAYQQALWIPDGCRSLSDMDFVGPFLDGQPLDFLPPNVTAVSIGNSYLSQVALSLVYRAWKMGQVESVCDLKASIFDVPVDSISELSPIVDGLCRTDSRLVAGFYAGADLDYALRPTSDQIVTLTNSARLYVAYNSRIEFLEAATILKWAAVFVGKESIADVDVVMFNTGNSMKDMIRIALPCGDDKDGGGEREGALSSPPCKALTAKLTSLANAAFDKLLDLGKVATLNVSEIMRELSTPVQNSSGAHALRRAQRARSQVVLAAPWNSKAYDFGEGIREKFPDHLFHFGGVFKSDADTCESDKGVVSCSPGWRHQCMPGPPDSMSDALSHIIWEELCGMDMV